MTPEPVMARKVVVLDDPETVTAEAARRFAELARQAVEKRGRFAVALSGGSTPRTLFRRLVQEPLRSETPWPRIEMFWGDERCVPPDHPDSNYRLAREALLEAVPIPPERIHRIRGEVDDPMSAPSDYEVEIARTLRGIPGGRPPSFDLVLLGMGRMAIRHLCSFIPPPLPSAGGGSLRTGFRNLGPAGSR